MHNKNISELTKHGYDRLENAHALIKLILNTSLNEETKIVLNMALSDIKSAIEIVIEMQNTV